MSQAASGGTYISKKINLVKNAANVRSALGAGDMLKTVYDINNDGIVDEAKKIVGFAATYLEATPTNGETNKAPNSNWAFDHNAAKTGIHGAGANTLLNSSSVIDGGTF